MGWQAFQPRHESGRGESVFECEISFLPLLLPPKGVLFIRLAGRFAGVV